MASHSGVRTGGQLQARARQRQQFFHRVVAIVGPAHAGMPGTEHQALYARFFQRPAAHRAGLHGRIQRAAIQPGAAQAVTGIADRPDLRMGGGITGRGDTVGTHTHHLSVSHNNRCYRAVTALKSLLAMQAPGP